MAVLMHDQGEARCQAFLEVGTVDYTDRESDEGVRNAMTRLEISGALERFGIEFLPTPSGRGVLRRKPLES